MKRLNAPPQEDAAAARGTQVTALNVLPARRSASVGGLLAALASVPAMTSTMDDNDARNENNAIRTVRALTMARFDGVSICME
jgi:hypothetical protein